MEAKTWRISVFVTEDDARTRAEAVLTTTAGTELRSVGMARRNPADRDVPEIGDELAVCRALNGLAHDLLEAAVMDVEQNVGAEASIDL
jgi:hypothetical protein